MSSVARSEATAAPVTAEPERRSAPPVAARALPDTVLWMQRTAGNAAVARSVAPAAQAIQRCGAGCGCKSCGADEQLLEDERLGAGLLRSAVANRSA